MADALTAATAILNAGWTFISANPVLFGICAVGVLSAGIHTVKGLF